MARPLMVRQPYSVAVPSTGGRLHPRFLRKRGLGRKWSSPCRRDGEVEKAFFNGKEGRVDFRNNTIMMNNFKDITVAVAGTGYVGLSIATLLSQHYYVPSVDAIPEKVEKLNNKISPIQDDYIEKYCYIAAA